MWIYRLLQDDVGAFEGFSAADAEGGAVPPQQDETEEQPKQEAPSKPAEMESQPAAPSKPSGLQLFRPAFHCCSNACRVSCTQHSPNQHLPAPPSPVKQNSCRREDVHMPAALSQHMLCRLGTPQLVYSSAGAFLPQAGAWWPVRTRRSWRGRRGSMLRTQPPAASAAASSRPTSSSSSRRVRLHLQQSECCAGMGTQWSTARPAV